MNLNTTYGDGLAAIQESSELEENIARLTEEFGARAITRPDQFKPMATEWIIDQFLPEGDSILAGESFVGKTYVLANLIATALGLVAHENLAASRRRKVVWISEDTNQILHALSVMPFLPGKSSDDFHKDCVLIPAQRIPADQLGPVIENLVDSYGWNDEHNPPLIVVDTMAASLECDDINSASKASKLLSALRQCWRDYSILITMHTAKGSDGTEAMGSVAFKADMQNAFYLKKYSKDETRREGGFAKRRANGRINRIITRVVDEVPKELPNREGDMVVEWIPVVEIIGQTFEEAKEMDESYKDEKEPKANRKASERQAFVDAVSGRQWEASSGRKLHALLVDELGDVAGSLSKNQTWVNYMKDEGLVVRTGNTWDFTPADSNDLI